MNHDEWLERAAIYALGALDGEELTQFERHLADGCPTCAERLRETQETLTLLPRSLTPIAPPSGVRVRLLEQIAVEGTSPRPVQRFRTRRWWGVGVSALMAAGLLLALSVNLYRTRQELHRVQGMLSTLQETLAQREQTLRTLSADLEHARQELQRVELVAATLRAELAKREETIQAERQELRRVEGVVAALQTALAEQEGALRVLSSPQVRLVRLSGLPLSPGATGQLLWNPTARTGLFLTSGLPQTPRGRIYELWAIAGDEPIPAGVFGVDEGGHALLRLPELPRAKRFSKFAVTLEPAGGLPKPSGPMYLLGNL